MPDVDEVITSYTNPTVKRVRALADRKHRRREGAFVVEGLQPVWRAVTASWTIDTLLVAPDLLTNARARHMVDEQQARGVRVVRVGAEVFGRLSDREGPSGLLAIVRGTVPDLSAFRAAGNGPVLALYHASNPGNVGTILRSADAAGAAGLILVGHTADPLSPSSVKASMGSVFAVPLAHAGDIEEFFTWADRHRRPVVAVTGRADVGLWAAELPPGAALLLGSEGDGLPDEVAGRCGGRVSIPMVGTAESLNLATAASVALYELMRRRHTGTER